VNKRRLLKLADLLEADAKNKKGIKFDMTHWAYIGNSAKPISCDTSACAMGLAALSGEYKRAGLGWKLDKYGYFKITMNGRGWALTAAMRLFGISRKQAEYLFCESSEEGAEGERHVAKFIRRFVKQNGQMAAR